MPGLFLIFATIRTNMLEATIVPTNKIILRSVYKITRTWMEPARDPKTGRFPDVVRRVNSQGDMVLSDEDRKTNKFFIAENDKIELFDGREFDLDKETDEAWWEAIKYSKRIAKDRAEKNKDGQYVIDGTSKRYGNAEFYIERPGAESRHKNTRKRDIHEAKSFVYEDAPENLYNKARLLGNAMGGATMSDVEEYLISVAERTPEKITQLYTGTDTHLRLFLLDAQDKRIITVKDNLYYYGEGIVLGATNTAVISYFKNPDNKRIVEMIKRETYPDLFGAEEVDAYSPEVAKAIQQGAVTTHSTTRKKQ